MKVSRKAAEREARRQELLKTQTQGAEPAQAGTEPPSPAPQENTGTAPPAAPQAGPDMGGVSRRSVGAGVDRMLGMARTGVIGELSETKEKLQAAQQAVESLDAELIELRPLKGADVVISVDPQTVRPTGYFNRIERSFSEKDRDFSELLEDIRRKGTNLVPGMIYKLDEPDGGFLYEAVYGHRRLAACSIAGVRFKAQLAPEGLSPEQVMALQVAENAFRKKMSAVEQGKKVASMVDTLAGPATGTRLKAGSLQLLNQVLKFKDDKYVGRLNTIGRTPDSVWTAFPDVRLVPFKAALLVARAYEKNPELVEGRVRAVPKGLSAKQIAAYLAEADNSGDAPARSVARYTFSVPSQSKAAFEAELAELLKKYGVSSP
jgi:hypothetical protein